MKRILVIVSICLFGAVYWLWKPGVALEEPASKESSSSRNETRLKDSSRVASLRAKPAPDSVEEGSQITLAIERLRKALQGGTDEELEAAQEALAQLLQNDLGVQEVWASFAAESDPNMLAQLARLLTPLVAANAELFQKVVELAQGGDLAAKRSAALSMLSSISDPGPELLDLIFQLSREQGAKEVQLSAIQLIGNWASHSQDWNDLSRGLVKTINASEEPEVRRFGIQVIALHPEAAPPEVVGAMADYLKKDPSAHNRAIAALGLGSVKGELRPSALGHLEQAFATEENINTRRNIITQIARAGEENAIGILNRLPVHQDPLLRQDVRDYVEILEAGGTGPDDIYFAKFERDKGRDTIVGSYDRHSD